MLIHYSATKLNREILLKTPGTAIHIVNTVFTDLERTENYRVNSNKVAFLSYFFAKKYLLVGASGMLWAVQ